jgi:hypothetical protein
MLARAAHNQRVAEGVAAAWLEAVRWVLGRPEACGVSSRSSAAFTRGVYGRLMPDLVALQASGDELAIAACLQVRT